MVTQMVENLTVINTREGGLSYVIKSPLMERYDFAAEPYMEFRKGVYVERYNDTTRMIEVTLSANYAINIQSQDLWEVKGSVVVVNSKGDRLETEQMFWNQKTHRIYSNVDSKVSNGTDVNYGSGFESDELMEELEFRDPRWDVEVPENFGREESGSTENYGSSEGSGGTESPEGRDGNGSSESSGNSEVSGGNGDSEGPSDSESTGGVGISGGSEVPESQCHAANDDSGGSGVAQDYMPAATDHRPHAMTVAALRAAEPDVPVIRAGGTEPITQPCHG